MGLDRNKSDWFIGKVRSEVDSLPIVVIRFSSDISSNWSTGSSLNSKITNGFSIWMITISFLFFKFNLETNITNFFGSGNNSMTTIVGLALGV
jgi:hypothetical protein